MEMSVVNSNSSNASFTTEKAAQTILTATAASDSNSAVSKEGHGGESGLLPFNSLKLKEQYGEQITISDQQVLKAMEKAIKAIEGPTTALQFSIHERTKHIYVKVLNKDTGEVIREIPPEKNLDFLANLWEKAGILVDERR